jgi:GNAT superfamily N-acetyltransferase
LPERKQGKVATVTNANPAQLEQVLDATYPVWGEALSRPAYGAWNRAQMATRWGQAHLRRVVLAESGAWFASAKRYDLEARVGTEIVPVLGIGAVFTPPDQRGFGHARRLVAQMMDEADRRGCRYALLFSEIGPDFYASMGFQPMPRLLASFEIEGRPGAPATLVRVGETADLPAIAAISARYAEGASFALDRSPEQIEFAFARRRLLAGLGPAGLRQVEFFVAEEVHRAVAYVFISRGPGGIILEELGDRDPSGARAGAILQVLAARTPAEPALRMTTWLPPALRPPQIRVLREFPAPEIMMIRLLGDAPMPPSGPIIYWGTDVF